jgi:hypothetical protein
MKRHVFSLAVAVVVAMTVLSGVIHGRMRNRWGPSPDMVAAAEKLAQIPHEFGDWRLQSTEEMNEATLNMLECAGYVVRNYVNRTTGDAVSVSVLLGPPGPIAVHTPEVCFASRNYESRGERKRVTIREAADRDDEFWILDFKLNNLQGDVLRTYYGWNAGERWVAPNDPRFQYAARPYLYKIQLSSRLQVGADSQSDDPCRRFLRAFVPAARTCLIDPSTE